ncbi:fructose-1,6-bisphosphatase II [Entomoplasma freundtii]|uniref:Fructose-1,6-bisphosphatase n=1 Tax=Entomoplasma freundtii TaxID=74700 RepID=A0A2K8NV34_9MOLU|nr:fructose-bisphosphatase class II [Entomoplasma freundtii]ATZ16611.1 fructose 1,6-bisphosphatase II [Entomoplasma freundtii]TDY58222.1 fructose-1,6-bisphosphatase II [Entomoplasma freundtii]
MNKDMVLLRAVEMAAIASYKYIGKKDKNALDGAAVEAMKVMLGKNIGIKLRVVNGEGELDNAPMFYYGQILGDVDNPHAPTLDMSVDPVEGTNPAAYNFAGSIATIAVSREGTMKQFPEMYMEKLFISPSLAGMVDFQEPLPKIVKGLQKKLQKKTLKAIILDKPRHEKIVKELDNLGVIVRLIKDGDVLGAIDVVNGEADFVYGVGGAPEAVLMASLAIASGAEMSARLVPYQEVWLDESETKERQDLEEKWLAKQTNLQWTTLMMAPDLVNDPRTRFFAAGITAGGTLKPIDYLNGKFYINTFMASHGIVRNLTTTYDVSQINNLKPEVKYLFDKYHR